MNQMNPKKTTMSSNKKRKNTNRRNCFYLVRNQKCNRSLVNIIITIAILCSLIPTKQQERYQDSTKNNNVYRIWNVILLADAATISSPSQQESDESSTTATIPSSPYNISPSPVASTIMKRVKYYKSRYLNTDINKETQHQTRNLESLSSSSSYSKKQDKKVVTNMSLNQIFLKAGKSGLGGGLQGAIAGVIQVLSLMWLRTIISYQYRYGTTFHQALQTLLNEGGISRLYRGLSFAILQAPLSRFGSTAANDSVQAFLSSFEMTKEWGLGRGTVIASIVVGVWRMILMPIDTCKTVLQVDSYEGFSNLMRKVRIGRIGVLYQGMFAQAISAVVAHYPWFYTYNYLNQMPSVKSLCRSSLLRNAAVGFIASVVSDTATNCIRVVKTMKQTIAAKHSVGYGEVISIILASDGWRGLFGRGLRTRILGNGLQSIVFTVVWRWLAARWSTATTTNDEQPIHKSSLRNSPNQKSTTVEE